LPGEYAAGPVALVDPVQDVSGIEPDREAGDWWSRGGGNAQGAWK
jgi:hypothetical protein